MATSTIQNMNSSSFKQSKTPSPLSRLRASYSRQQHLSSEYWQQRLNNSPAELDRRTKQMPSRSGLLRTLLLQEDDDIERVTNCLKRDLRELADDELLNDLTTAILRCRIRRLKRKQLNSNDAPLSPKPKSLDSATNVIQDSLKKNKMRSSLRLDTTVPASSTNSRISGNIGDGDSPSPTSTNSCSSGSAPVPAQQRVQFLKEARQRRFGENEVQPKKQPEVPCELAGKYQDMSLQDGETKDETNKKKEQDNEQAQTNPPFRTKLDIISDIKIPKMDDQQQFCLRWNDFQTNMVASFKHLREEKSFTDVTIACDGQSCKAHKMILSACSPYFKALLEENPAKHPIIILKDVPFQHLTAILEFMYAGEVNVAQDQLPQFLKTAERLKVKGLAEAPQSVKNE